jgi:purine-binding chemotaxis protein CheW
MENQYVIVKVGKEEYAINIIDIQEISRYQEITRLPETPNHIEGIINYRGNVISIINLGKRLNQEAVYELDKSRIVIINYNNQLVGLHVSDASETLKITDTQVEDVPISIAQNHSPIVKVAKLENRLISIIDINILLSN